MKIKSNFNNENLKPKEDYKWVVKKKLKDLPDVPHESKVTDGDLNYLYTRMTTNQTSITLLDRRVEALEEKPSGGVSMKEVDAPVRGKLNYASFVAEDPNKIEGFFLPLVESYATITPTIGLLSFVYVGYFQLLITGDTIVLNDFDGNEIENPTLKYYILD